MRLRARRRGDARGRMWRGGGRSDGGGGHALRDAPTDKYRNTGSQRPSAGSGSRPTPHPVDLGLVPAALNHGVEVGEARRELHREGGVAPVREQVARGGPGHTASGRASPTRSTAPPRSASSIRCARAEAPGERRAGQLDASAEPSPTKSRKYASRARVLSLASFAHVSSNIAGSLVGAARHLDEVDPLGGEHLEQRHGLGLVEPTLLEVGRVELERHHEVVADSRAHRAHDLEQKTPAARCVASPHASSRRLLRGERNWLTRYPCAPWICTPSKPAFSAMRAVWAKRADDLLDLERLERARLREQRAGALEPDGRGRDQVSGEGARRLSARVVDLHQHARAAGPGGLGPRAQPLEGLARPPRRRSRSRRGRARPP
jgi:hypothetical protein